MLAIETDDHADALRTWQALLLHATTVANIPDLRSETRHWGERAVPDSIGYRLVHDYRAHALQIVFGAYTSLPITPRSAWSVETLLTRRPSGLVSPGFDSWDNVDRAIIARIQADVAKAGTLSQFTWGRANHVGIHHPLSRFIPGLHVLTDPPGVAEAGDTMLPRVAVPGFGASERQVISPGHEEQALFDMPMGEASDPLAPYYGAGQADWVAGRAEPLLLGPIRWTLVLTP
ncbi:penicillin acylase II [Tanticharoenia sakaeratensis NBRC 103193]|uniref:Penicillin acylase II n=1 Tax=Tanticharoenia sakaeratensis NBRC 103193 TaxID=1231623 RepID=A0A0D6MMR0_9PROT|nr:penicillin acylase II [Tanticharoenia sakaeratensis NBRC 103193]GBQ22566.1 family S45 unassigned peptidase [Tanticharoenia sakaeratensis NBRC 103193]